MEKLYFGIDLGTTNSAIAYGHIGSNGKIKTNICKVNRYGKSGGLEGKDTLPSVVYYKQDPKNNDYKIMVGDFAKNQYGKKYGTVMKSVKNYMGGYSELPLDSKIMDKRPEEVSAQILKHLLAGIKDKLTLSEEPKDVIITIPASFDSDQCIATLKAAELAGLNVIDNDGNYINDRLLYEPKAVIYNVANMVANDEIPRSLIDFDTRKSVLVFDLGGGTLDVALYSVYNNKELDFPVIDEIAVGRYTRIGGDDFDKLLGKVLVNKFLDYNNCTEKDVSIEELTQLMESKGEDIKLELSDKMINAQMSKGIVPDSCEFEISEMDIYKGMEFDTSLTKEEIENILSPIMGNHLNLSDFNKIESLTSERDVNNIVYPILDVLAKAKESGKQTSVDAVILNGGMTKFYLIKDRIEELFNIKPIVVNDPDLSVAKGAAFYQYCLEKVKRNKLKYSIGSSQDRVITSDNKSGTLLQLGSSIVNDTINLGLSKGYVIPLIKAGTSVPTGDIEIDSNLKIPVGTDRIELPIYLGRGKTTEAPNRKIANRIITLKKKYEAGTPITLVANVDENKVLTLSGLIGENKKEKISITVDTDGNSKDREKSNKIVATDLNIDINPATELETLRANCEILERCIKNSRGQKMSPIESQKHKNAKFKISDTVASIKSCQNKSAFEKGILERLGKLNNSSIYKGYLYDIGVTVFPHMSVKGQEEFKKLCRDIVNITYMGNNLNKDNIIKAIIALGKVKDRDSEKMLERLIGENRARIYLTNLVRALGEISPDNTLICKNFLSISTDKLELDPYIYAVGKSFSRDISGRTDKEIERVMKKLIDILKLEKQNKDMALIALGEIGYNLEDVQYRLDEKFLEGISRELAIYIKEKAIEQHRDKATLVLNLLHGLELTEEEKILWNSLKK